MDREIPKQNHIYQSHVGEIFKILAVASYLKTETLIVAYQSLDDRRCEACSVDDFLSVLGDGSEGTCYYAFSLITEYGNLWEKLELARQGECPHTHNTTFLQLLDIEEIDGRDFLEIGAAACTKITALLKSFENARNITIDLNPGKYSPGEKPTPIEEWVALEKGIFTGLLAIKVNPNPKYQE